MQPSAAPSRHEMAVLTFLGLIAPVYYVPDVVAASLPLSRLGVVLVSLAVIVPVMTYLVMPALLWVFRGLVAPPPRGYTRPR